MSTPTPTAPVLDQANDLQPSKTAVAGRSRHKRVRARSGAKSAPAGDRTPESEAQRGSEAEHGDAQLVLSEARKNVSPLLIGAGIGAAVALSVVALRPREKRPTIALFASPNSTFFTAIIKTVAFAVAQSSAKGSLKGLIARAVGKAVA